MTVVDCTAPLNRYTCYGAIEVVAIIIIIIIKQQVCQDATLTINKQQVCQNATLTINKQQVRQNATVTINKQQVLQTKINQTLCMLLATCHWKF